MNQNQKNNTENHMPDEVTFQKSLKMRHMWGKVWRTFYAISVFIAILALIVLFLNVVNSAFGSVATLYEVDPNTLSADGRPIEALSAEELVAVLIEHQGGKMPVLVREHLSTVPNEQFTESTLSQLHPNAQYPEGYADATVNDIRALDKDDMMAVFGEFMLLNMSRAELEIVVLEEIVKLEVVEAWSLYDAIFHYEDIIAARDASYPDAELVRYKSWTSFKFLQTPMSSMPSNAGIRTALLGSLMMMLIVIHVSLPLGVGTALYLEEYARDNFLAKIPQRVESALANVALPQFLKNWIIGLSNFNELIELNVRNLAGVPSIIYGMLGLAIFVRLLAPVTSGVAFGVNVEVPSDERIANLISEAIEVEFQLNAEGEISGIETNEYLSYPEVESLVDTFRHYGTPSLTNTGDLSLVQAEEALAKLLGINILSELPTNNALDYTEIEAGYINFSETTFDAANFEALAQQLTRITGFTINGRTILSAALTLSLLILPIIIINAQEALRAVPYSLREASYGLGATKWQTIWRTVLPASIPGIMTGTILAISRAIGETAPLIVVGASTFLLTDPDGLFSKFTVLPIQIYTWTSRPQGEFQFIAAAAIIVLLALVVGLNAIAIVVRNKFDVRY